MSTMASKITSLTIVYATVYSRTYQRKHQSSASLAFARGIHRPLVNSPHKWPVTRKCFHFMTSSCTFSNSMRHTIIPCQHPEFWIKWRYIVLDENLRIKFAEAFFLSVHLTMRLRLKRPEPNQFQNPACYFRPDFRDQIWIRETMKPPSEADSLEDGGQQGTCVNGNFRLFVLSVRNPLFDHKTLKKVDIDKFDNLTGFVSIQ